MSTSAQRIAKGKAEVLAAVVATTEAVLGDLIAPVIATSACMVIIMGQVLAILTDFTILLTTVAWDLWEWAILWVLTADMEV